MRGNWPLVPTMDVVVPHTRTMDDLLEVLDVLVADDHETRGDFWRVQPWVPLPSISEIRPFSYPQLANQNNSELPLSGVRFGVPKLYINADQHAGTGPNHRHEQGIGGPMGEQIITRDSVLACWQQAKKALESLGAKVIEVDFPVVTNYEGDRPGAPTIATRGLVPPEFLLHEVEGLAAWAWEDFLQANGDPQLSSLRDVSGDTIFPHPKGALEDRYHGFDDDISTYPQLIAQHGFANLGHVKGLTDPDLLKTGIKALEETRQLDMEHWMDQCELDAIIFPAMADVGPADADTSSKSADAAWRNGVWVANGNLVPRHLGIPTVTVPMGMMQDIEVPVGLTFAGRAYDDTKLLSWAHAFDSRSKLRSAPIRTKSNKESA